MGAMIIAKIGDLVVLTQPARYLPMPECLHPLTNQDNWIIVIPIWKNVVLAIFDMPFTMRLNMSAFGMNPLEHILQRSARRTNIITLPYSMLQRNLSEPPMQWENQDNHATMPLNSFL